MKRLVGVVVAVVALSLGVLAAGSLSTPKAPLAPTPPPFLTPAPGASTTAPTASEASEAGLLSAYVVDAYATTAASASTGAVWYPHVRQSGGALQIEVRGTTASVYTDMPKTEAAGPVAMFACMGVAAVTGDASTGTRLGVLHVVILGGTGREEMTNCDAPPLSTPQAPHLRVHNATAIDVTLFVNGQYVEIFPAGQPQPAGDQPTMRPQQAVEPWALPPLPWSVEARSPSGRVLTTVTISQGDGYQDTAGRVGQADLSCGRIDVYVGDIPIGPVPPSPAGSPGDCAP